MTSSFLFPVYIPFEDRFDARYHTLQQLGEGAHGQTFLVEERDDRKRKFVLKKVNFEHGHSSSFIEFVFEIHTHYHAYEVMPERVPKLHEWWIWEQHGYIIMEYFPLGSMYNVFKGFRSLTEVNTVMDLWREFARHGIFHGDVKPPNILLRDFDSFVFADWGVAVVLDKFTFEELKIIIEEKSKQELARVKKKLAVYVEKDEEPAKKQAKIRAIRQTMYLIQHVRSICEKMSNCRNFLQELLFYEMAYRVNHCLLKSIINDGLQLLYRTIRHELTRKYGFAIEDASFFEAFHRYVDWLRNVLWLYQMEKAERQFIEQFIADHQDELKTVEDVKSHAMYRYLNQRSMIRAFERARSTTTPPRA